MREINQTLRPIDYAAEAMADVCFVSCGLDMF